MNDSALAALLSAHAVRHDVPAAGLGILRDGAITCAYHGVEVMTGEPVTAHTRFAIGSLTKPLVATVLARLASAGRLAFDDPVTGYVPELRGCGWAERATLRDLLANRSGLPLSIDLEFGFAARSDTDDGALARFAADVARAKPTPVAWSYSNAGWSLLGRAIEAATGRTWEDAMLAELGRDCLRDSSLGSIAGLPGRAYAPAGTSIASTVPDLLRLAALHLADSSLDVLRTTQAEIPIHGWLDAWCLGWARFDWPGGPVWGWDGVIGDARSVVRLVPERRGAVVFAAQGGPGRALYRAVVPEVMQDAFGIGVPPLRLDGAPGAAGDVSRFSGVYAWPDEQVVVTSTAEGLRIESSEGRFDALPLDGRTFVVDAGNPDTPTMTFGAFDERGRPQVVYVMVWGFPRVGGN